MVPVHMKRHIFFDRTDRLFRRGERALAERNFVGAAGLLREAIKTDPDYPHLYMYLGRALAELGQLDEATSAIGRAKALAPGNRFQVRVVAFAGQGVERHAAQDADAETIWCSEVEQLRTLLSEAGHETELETAMPPGAVALKTVPASMDDAQRREQRPSGGYRSLGGGRLE